jgi:CRP-like cAMP-binding protein
MKYKDYIVDDSTKRLLELTSTQERNEDALDEIINLVNEKAPKVFESLSMCNQIEIAKSLYLKCYEFGAIVFRQGDLPDAYYTVIRGAISIYAHSSNLENVSDQRRYVCQ